jgi:hypothetical protein
MALGMALGLSLTLAAGAQAAAADSTLFTAHAVPVDAEAKNVSEAREIALADGQRDGLMAVLRRLTRADDWGRLPKLSQSQAAAMVDSIQVEDEKSSSVRYLANLTIAYKGGEVRRLLQQAGLPYSESRAQPTLVLPVFAGAGGDLLFEEDNPWLAAWSAYRSGPGSLFPLVAPIGDLEDIAAIDARLALAGDAAALARIAPRYGAINTLVAKAGVQGGKLRLNLQWHGPLRTATEVLEVPVRAEESEAGLMLRAAAQTASTLEERWKRETLRQADAPVNTLDARLLIDGLPDWVAARRALEASGIVRRYEVASMTPRSVQLQLHYQGGPEQLALSLAQSNLELVRDGDGWRLSLRQGSPGRARE